MQVTERWVRWLRSTLLAGGTLFLLSKVLVHASVVLAQSAAQPEPSPSPPALSGENSQEEVEEEEKPPRLRLPEGSVAPARSSPSSTASSKTESNPMQREGQPPSDPTIAPWTTPQTLFEVHGYMRMRGEFIDHLFLGRGRIPGNNINDFFAYWQPLDDGVAPEGGCSGGRETAPGLGPGGGWSVCDQNALAFANLRLRLEPSIHLSDDVRVRMQIDLLDNLVMGSTPSGLQFNSNWQRTYGTVAPAQVFATTQDPPIAGINSFSDSIVVRRAWGEVRNRGLGELRFGRMGAHWGLGILFNDGRGIDQDHQTDVDRIMAITRIFGIYLFGAWDFASEGMVYFDPVDHWYQRVSFDRVRMDDVDQMVFGVARRLSPEEQAQALARREMVLNGGLLFMYRTQNLSTEGVRNPFGAHSEPIGPIVRRGYETFTGDIWMQLLYESLRLEVEAVGIFGTIDNLPFTFGSCPDNSCIDRTIFVPNNGAKHNILQMGLAFEGEYRLLNDQLAVSFYFGIASGDADTEGLSLRGGSLRQLDRPGGPDRTLSTFFFHPAYRIDLLLFRNLLGQIGGSYYFRPGLSYDFIRSSFGQLLGARADVVWSRAVEPIQTWGNQADLGVEIDLHAYYRSEDGPDPLDGFTLSLMYGILFPLGGLNYNAAQLASGFSGGGQNAQTLRLILGINY